MVGLDRFKEAFAEFLDNYVIIGGTACDIAMTGTAVRPRATHDIDMIVVVENMSLRGLFNIISNHSQTLTVTAFNVVTLVSLGRCIIKH